MSLKCQNVDDSCFSLWRNKHWSSLNVSRQTVDKDLDSSGKQTMKIHVNKNGAEVWNLNVCVVDEEVRAASLNPSAQPEGGRRWSMSLHLLSGDEEEYV